VWGGGRAARQAATRGDRHGEEEGTLQTAAGVLRVNVAPGRGLEAPYRSPGGLLPADIRAYAEVPQEP